MSKKKSGKKPAKKTAAVKKSTPKKAASKKASKKKAARPARALAAMAPEVPGKRNNTATIFLYKVDGSYRVRTSPQLICATPGDIEWTVVNLASDEEVDVEITWPKGGPWGGEANRFKAASARAGGGHVRPVSTRERQRSTEDPEIEFPEGS